MRWLKVLRKLSNLFSAKSLIYKSTAFCKVLKCTQPSAVSVYCKKGGSQLNGFLHPQDQVQMPFLSCKNDKKAIVCGGAYYLLGTIIIPPYVNEETIAQRG